MGVKAQFNPNVVGNKVAEFQNRVENAALFTLQYLGESLVSYARDHHTYKDQTGNLTNSMGYAVVRGSRIVHYGGNIQPGEGADNGLKVAMQMAANLQHTFSLIIVAGMDYAAYVEAKGYDVILPAELKARKDFPKAMKQLAKKAEKKAMLMFK